MYDMLNPLNQQEKDEIFRPSIVGDKKYYPLFLELKLTNSKKIIKELN